MKSYFFAALAAVLMLCGGGANAREVAFCTPGFDIQKVSGDRAVCAKTETAWVNKGTRHCLAGGHLISEEASNGGDKCSGTGLGSMVSGPAIACEIDLAYGPGHRTVNIRNGRDECQKEESRTVFGNIQTRSE